MRRLLATSLRGTASNPDIIYAWLGAISKVEKDSDGNAYVYGKVTDGTVDSDDQIVDPAFAKKALAEWYETAANVRQMHSTSLPPAGKGVLLESKEDGEYVRTKVVEPTAIKLVDNDVYTGYSVGISRPRIERDLKARGGRITGGKIVEISLVDRPANPMAKFAVLKASRGGLAFVGKSMTIPEAYRTVKPPRVRRFNPSGMRKGRVVRLDVNDEFGGVSVVEGRFLAKGVGSVALDQAGFTNEGAVKRLQLDDIIGVHKAAGVRHTHMHPGPDGNPHDHEHTHAPNHGDHSQTHAHDHSSTEDSVADTQAAPAANVDDDSAGPDADDGAKCGKCGGSGSFKGGKCAACGGSGIMAKGKTTKAAGKAKPGAAPVDPGPDAQTTSPDRDIAPGDDQVDPGPDAQNTDPSADVGPGEPEVDPGPDADDQSAAKAAAKAAKKAAKAAKKAAKQAAAATKGVQVVGVETGGWAVTKDGATVGTHTSQGAALAQANALKAEQAEARKAAKAARKAAQPSTIPAEVPWLVRRAHDYACSAYKTDDVAAAYPTLDKSGIGSVIGGSTRSAVYSALVGEVDRDGGTGEAASSIAALGKSLGALQDLIATKADTTEARAELHEAFKAANGMGADGASGSGIPKPSESITPGQFSRGYISAGHQQEKASDHSAKIPTTTHPVSPSDFGRGPITEGHQRYLTSKLADLHDGLADWRPEICRTSTLGSDGSFAFDRQPYPSASDRPPFLRTIPNQQTEGPKSKPVTSPASSAGPGIAKHIEADVVPGVSFPTNEDFEMAVSKMQEPLLTKFNDLEAKYEALASAPDPTRSAPRGVTGLARDGKVEKLSHIGGAVQKERQGRKAEKIEYLRSIATSGSTDARLDAQARLQRMGVEIS